MADHLERGVHRHELEDTNGPNPGLGQPMQRISEDVSESLDIVLAKFVVHRHIYGMAWPLLPTSPGRPAASARGRRA